MYNLYVVLGLYIEIYVKKYIKGCYNSSYNFEADFMADYRQLNICRIYVVGKVSYMYMLNEDVFFFWH